MSERHEEPERHIEEYSFPRNEEIDSMFQWGSNALVDSEMNSDDAYAEFFKDAPYPHFEGQTADGAIFKFNRDNTLLMEYPTYPEFDHIVHEGESGFTYYMWREQLPKIFSKAKELGFDIVKAVVPSQSDYRLWMDSQMKRAFRKEE